MIDWPSFVAGGFICSWVAFPLGWLAACVMMAVKAAEEGEQMRRTARGRFKSWRDFNTQHGE